MATPARKLIIDSVVEALGTIAAPTYKTTVRKVERVAKEWSSVPEGEKPWLGVTPGKERYEYEPMGHMKATLQLNVVGHVAAEDPDAAGIALSDLVDDVIAALSVETTRGVEDCIRTNVVDSETDEGDPDATGNGSIVITVEVTYLRTTRSS